MDSNEHLTEAYYLIKNITQTHDNHLFSTINNYQPKNDHNHDGPFPFSNLFLCCALLVMFFLDKILESIVLWQNRRKSSSYKKEDHDHKEHEKEHEYKELYENHSHSHSHDHENVLKNDKELDLLHDHKHSISTEVLFNNPHHREDHPHHHEHTHLHLDQIEVGTKGQRVLGGLILWFSLVSHSFFEGLGFGAASQERAIDLFFAIISHHFVAALALGTVLNQRKTNIFLSIFFIASFSFSVPIGTIVGILISQLLESIAFLIVQGIALSIASGVFLYVATFEILAFFDPSKPLILCCKIIMFTVGFTLMSVVTFFH